MSHYAESNFYELLELEPGATPSEIDEAHKKQMDLLSGDALATYGLFVGDDLVAARQRVEDAYRVLRDPVRRRAYDASGYAHAPEPEAELPVETPVEEAPLEEAALEAHANATPTRPAPQPPEPVARRAPKAKDPNPPAAEPLASEPVAPKPVALESAAPKPVAAGPDGSGPVAHEPPGVEAPVPEPAGYDGPAFRAAREARGVTLGEISGRTRIAEYYLGYIEEERFDQLPPIIYLRSYLRQYAAAIGLDPENAINDYLARYNEKKARKQADRL